MNSRLWTSGMYPGRNHMGTILMKVRDKMVDTNKHLKTMSSSSMKPNFPAQSTSTCTTAAGTDSNPTDTSQNRATALPLHSDEQMEVTHEEVSSSQSSQDHETVSQTSGSLGPTRGSHDSSGELLENSPFRNFTTNHEFDICKVKSWKLPTVKRNTKEWTEKERARGLLKRQRSDKGDKSDKTPPKKSSPSHNNNPPQRKKTTRSFINSNYQSQLLAEHGYNAESNYQRAMAHYNSNNITDRRSLKKRYLCMAYM